MGTQQIAHVFVLMLENHSFDNVFAFSGIPGIEHATSANSEKYKNVRYPVSSPAPPSMPTDPGHEFLDVVEQLCGPNASGEIRTCCRSMALAGNPLWLPSWGAMRFRHRSAVLCPNDPQLCRKRGKVWTRPHAASPRVSAGRRPHSPVMDPRLKIVVSPVRVRVSPSSNKALQSCSFCN